MKKLMKHLSKVTLVALLGVLMFVMTGCTAVQISTNLTLGEDGTGSRTITASIAKKDYQDGYGSAYYYLTKHGDELAQYLQSAYETAVPGSEDWLSVSVNDNGADWEVIDLSFDFASFEDYTTKLASLAFDQAAAATYVAPALTINDDGTATYTENAAALTAIFKSIQTSMMADTSIFDAKSTKDGVALNDGSADLKSLADFGVELMKPEFGDAMTVQLGSDAAVTVAAADGAFTLTGNYVVSVAATDDTAGTTDTAVETTVVDVPKTGESVALAAISLLCIAGCAVGFMATNKRKAQDQ